MGNAKHIVPNNNMIVMGEISQQREYETVLLGADQVNVGVSTGKTVIVKDSNGFFRETNEVIGKEVYNIRKQSHPTWFALALETGGRGWYPGSWTWGNIPIGTPIYESDDETSQIIATSSQDHIRITTKLDNTGMIRWYSVVYDGLTGYIKHETVTSIYYTDPISG